jgi:hypothetical protein
MRKLPLLLVLLVLALLVGALPAQADLPLQAARVSALLQPDPEAGEDEAEEAGDPGDEEDGEVEEACEPEEEELCEEDEESRGKREAEEDGCLLKSGSAAISVNPAKRRLRLSVHYKTWKAAGVSVDAALSGVKGAVYLGSSQAHFRRSGVYRDTFVLAEKQTKKALAAREVSVDLHVVDSPPSCDLRFTEAVHRPKH